MGEETLGLVFEPLGTVPDASERNAASDLSMMRILGGVHSKTFSCRCTRASHLECTSHVAGAFSVQRVIM